jgi:hypothetical protein
MEINAGFIIWAVISLASLALSLSLAVWSFPGEPRYEEKRAARMAQRGKRYTVAAETTEIEAESVSAEHAEVIHWTEQGLRKFGYSKVEAHRMAAKVPAGLDLQQALQWCLQQRGKNL